MIRTDYGCSISRFAELVGVPRRTYHARLARLRAGEVPKGPWPAPVVDRIEATVAKYAAEWPAWGHRKIAAIAARRRRRCGIAGERESGHGPARSVAAGALPGRAPPARSGPAGRHSWRRRCAPTASGRPISPSSRPPARAPGGCVRWWTTPPSWPWRARCPRPRAPPTGSRRCRALSRPPRRCWPATRRGLRRRRHRRGRPPWWL